MLSLQTVESGRVFGWGNHEYKQLGVDCEAPQLAQPQLVECGAMDGRVTSVTPGGPFTAFLTSAFHHSKISLTVALSPSSPRPWECVCSRLQL